MRIMVEVELEVNLEGGRANIDEISESVDEVGRESRAKLMRGIVERYQEGVVQVLCSPSGRQAKRGLGVHSKKGQEEHRCRCRTFRRAGTWAQPRRLHAKDPEVEFRPEALESRNAVEKAIDSSKAGQGTTWQGAAVRLRKSIRPWEDVARSEARQEDVHSRPAPHAPLLSLTETTAPWAEPAPPAPGS